MSAHGGVLPQRTEAYHGVDGGAFDADDEAHQRVRDLLREVHQLIWWRTRGGERSQQPDARANERTNDARAAPAEPTSAEAA